MTSLQQQNGDDKQSRAYITHLKWSTQATYNVTLSMFDKVNLKRFFVLTRLTMEKVNFIRGLSRARPGLFVGPEEMKKSSDGMTYGGVPCGTRICIEISCPMGWEKL